MPELIAKITRCVDDGFPCWVECSFTDAWGQERFFRDKVPMFTCQTLDAGSAYPQPGVIDCRIVRQWRDATGREIVTVDTREPWDLEALDGAHRFDVLAEKVHGSDHGVSLEPSGRG